MTRPVSVAIERVPGVLLGCAVFLTAGCASMGDGAYRASSLELFVASRPTRLEAGGMTLVAGRLENRDEVLRVLGARSGKLFAEGIVVQASVAAGAEPVRLGPDAFALVLGSGEELRPAGPEQVLAAVSLPEPRSATVEEMPFGDAAAPRLPGEHRSAPVAVGELNAFMALTISGIDAAVTHAGAAQYRRQAREDVIAKTTVPAEVRSGETRDLLLVFVPPGRPALRQTPLGLRVTLAVAGTRLDRTISLE